ncbi:MAG: bifunctional diaminohydroxyphosphoribosylaminopyrimidine deaminase/5-amino-6-(5-phosphoribosylamino)uracil reductase RibD [Nitrospirae bacterium]|nr:bifunctional diaminohydroxyphosphoribosylaminopyrimidine deaminase/5-amino-6-(5-phosphoribosylamino)uracil reductase RibD [Nitrospirota bacterium]
MNADEKYMSLALKLAERGRGRVSPNPMVGAVIVKQGKVVGKGYHARAGFSHAEVLALKEAGRKAKSATLYVNLEPCSHFGRTPPCVNEIITAGIGRVVIAMKDPNPLNYGRGIRKLRASGIKVTTCVLEDRAKRINEAFHKFITEREPFMVLKVATSLDGKIATSEGKSKWITGSESRQYVQKLRREADAVLVGINTVLKDDPRLTVRNGNRGKDCRKGPLRVIVDSRARIPLEAKVLKGSAETIVATTRYANKTRIRALEKRGARVLIVGSKKGKVDLAKLMKELGKLDIVNLLVEGGGEINASAFASRLVDKAVFFLAPRIIGGKEAPTAVEGEGIKKISQAIPLRDIKIRKIGDDLMVEAYPCYVRKPIRN